MIIGQFINIVNVVSSLVYIRQQDLLPSAGYPSAVLFSLLSARVFLCEMAFSLTDAVDRTRSLIPLNPVDLKAGENYIPLVGFTENRGHPVYPVRRVSSCLSR